MNVPSEKTATAIATEDFFVPTAAAGINLHFA